jgi:hypothetical protein
MNNQAQGMDLGFTTERIPDCFHLCLIYDSEEQRRKIVAEFLAAGLRHGELVRYFADKTPPEDICAWFLKEGIETSKYEKDESFRILKAENAYCPSGRLVPREVLDNAISRYAMAGQAGYSGSRVTGEMTWVLRGIPGSERLLEYEIGLNAIQDEFPHIGMCQYDARLLDGAMLFKVLQVHPYMVAQGQIVRNPFYIKPEEFL